MEAAAGFPNCGWRAGAVGAEFRAAGAITETRCGGRPQGGGTATASGCCCGRCVRGESGEGLRRPSGGGCGRWAGPGSSPPCTSSTWSGAVLRTLVNGWTTSARTCSGEVGPCAFGCAPFEVGPAGQRGEVEGAGGHVAAQGAPGGLGSVGGEVDVGGPEAPEAPMRAAADVERAPDTTKQPADRLAHHVVCPKIVAPGWAATPAAHSLGTGREARVNQAWDRFICGGGPMGALCAHRFGSRALYLRRPRVEQTCTVPDGATLGCCS